MTLSVLKFVQTLKLVHTRRQKKKKKNTSNLYQENAWQCTSLELTPEKKKGKGKEKTQHD